MKPDSLKALAAPFLAVSAPHGLTVAMGDMRIGVRTNSPALAKELSDYFRDFLDREDTSGAIPDVTITALEEAAPELDLDYTLKEPEPGKSKIKEEYADFPDGRVVRKRITGMVFMLGGPVQLAIGPCLANPNQVVNFVNNRYIEWRIKQGALLFHAAGVAKDGRGIAMAGFSGMGKSTLALHVMCKGADFVSNDRLMVEHGKGGLVMHGVAKMPRVNPGTVLHNEQLASVIPDDERELFAQLPPEELWPLEHKYDAFIDECFGEGRFKLKSRMAALFLLNWKRDGGPLQIKRVDLARRPDLLPAFMKQVGLFFAWDADSRKRDFSETAYLALLEGCPVFELSGGIDFAAASTACMEFLDNEDPSTPITRG